jgi:carbon monoxide dehydrogenase subunit G
MARVEVQDEIDAAKETVWDLVSDFGGVGRISPEVQSCEVEGDGVGAVRTINLSGMVIRERLEGFDGKSCTFSYSMLEGPIPFKNYLAHVTLSDAGANRTRIKWAGSFEPAGGVPAEQLEQLVQGIYRGLIAGVKKAAAS